MKTVTDHFTAKGFGRVLVISGHRGDCVHELIEKKMAEKGMRNGVVLSGIATFQKFNYHDGAFEVTALQGVILNGKAHLHAAAQDHYTTIIGHVERETEILYLAEIVVAELLLDQNVERIKVAEGFNQYEIES